VQDLNPAPVITVTGPGTQTLTVAPNITYFTLSFNGVTTGLLDLYSPTVAADIQNALNALSVIGPGGVTVAATATFGVFSVTFNGALATTVTPIIGTGVSGSFPAASLTKLGNGTVVFPNASNYTGETYINQGALNIQNPSALGNGAPEVQELIIFGPNGTFTLGFNGSTSATPIDIAPYNPITVANAVALATAIQNALNALPSISSMGSVTVTALAAEGGNLSAFAVVFNGALAMINVPQISATTTGGKSMN